MHRFTFPEIAIVGGGFSGTAVAVNLLRAGDDRWSIHLVEREGPIGRGVAYGTPDDAHLLNVPAGAMSLRADRPSDFVAYASARLGPVAQTALLPRRLYGEYLSATLQDASEATSANFVVHHSAAVAVQPEGARWMVQLADGRTLTVDHVVFATGNGPPRLPPELAHLEGDSRFVRDPWAAGALDAVAPSERVLLVGTGLTAIDVTLSLHARGLHGPLHATSRGGRWPRPHLPEVCWAGPKADIALDAAPATADGLSAWFEAAIARAHSADIPWQAVLEAMRPHISMLWGRLSEAERARFLKAHRAGWEVLRHRTPRPTYEKLRAWREAGWLTTHRGGIESVQTTPYGLEVAFHGGDAPAVFDRIVLCTGAESDPSRVGQLLWHDLIAHGLVVPDPHGLGILTDERGAVIGSQSAPPGLWAMGGLQRPRQFESTSVPELALQAQKIAAAILAAPVRGA
jgi:uncharacterized NAD(P)/FAD-binding protein YdhS